MPSHASAKRRLSTFRSLRNGHRPTRFYDARCPLSHPDQDRDMKRLLPNLALASTLVLLPTWVMADEIPTDVPPMGAPRSGVDVPLQMRPEDSQRVLMQQGESAPRGQASGRRGAATEPASEEDASEARVVRGAQLETSTSLSAPQSLRLRSPDELYGGLIPGLRDMGERLPSERERALTWFGMQLDRAERTRLAIQISENVRYELRPSGSNRLVVQLQNAQLAIHQLHRDVDASHFGRSVHAVRARSVGPHVELTIDLNRAGAPTVSREGGFLFLDFDEAGSAR